MSAQTGFDLFPDRSVVAIRVNGELKDKATTVETTDTVEPVEIGSLDGLNILRHSTAHVLAQAVHATLGTHVSPAAVYRGMHDMRHILRLAHGGVPVRSRLQKLEHLLGRSGMASSFIRPAEPLAADCANREHRPWQSANGERTESFGDLFDAAVPLAVSLQRAVLDRYFQNKPLDPRFFPSDFNGNPVKNEK